MKILFLTSRLPFPPVGGDKLRTFNFLRYLKREHQVTLLSFIESKAELNYLDEYRGLYDEIYTVTLPKWISYKNCIKGLVDTKPLQVLYYQSSKMSELVKRELVKGYDVAFCHLIRMAQYLPVDQRVAKIIDFTDAISLNYERSKAYRTGIFSLINRIESKRVKPYELATIKKSDASIFISEIDSQFLTTPDTKGKISVVPNGVALDRFQFYQGEYDPDQTVFVGNMRTFPNTDAVIYFVREILPILIKKRPRIRFYVVGTEPNHNVRALDNGKTVFVTGFVDSVLPYINNSVALVAPMRVGAGVQNKILEAMAAGTPVVTTTIGAEGLEPNEVLIGDGPEEFATHILSLIENSERRRRLALKGRRYIEQNFTWEKAFIELDKILLNLPTNSPTAP